ncbi:hypothetical protein TWF106_009059 [Orbilia oligospora]|uniref:HPt domain-containing protein n=1 Tax=Orbilia oligospora TaxID=2813651 RepID=A0A6G1LX15_ORBOL|nr:hypothetical protein TWF788_008422 [Orbilia oligospora]KAF3208602.1 hypothetical protein TWF679_007664 [Orbilia oligospora]KAF3214369.1 hypothetical protein TWF106_009059 [Orbilia oligospora]KAF3224933.1 hypothetical protein TWF191_005781 [Orbilia oligospora]KAF3236320.1 hypothetical protein TWF192_011455 [Orbilia oligospora]
MSDGETYHLPDDATEYVDVETFEQILEMDDGDPDQEFSRGLVTGFFEQANSTFDEMDESIQKKDLAQLSSLGHFLKGSSATLGLFRVRDTCEKIQHLGALKDETGNLDIKEEEALRKITKLLPKMKEDYNAAEDWLKKFFGVEDEEDDEPVDPKPSRAEPKAT